MSAIKSNSKIKNEAISLVSSLRIEEVRKCARFVDVDEVPAFNDCAKSKGNSRLECFNQEMIKHIETYFHYPEDAVINKTEGEVWVRFIIDKEGNVTNLKTHASKGKKILKEEAIRVISLLPKFIPATNSGVSVPVKYGFPINFSLTE